MLDHTSAGRRGSSRASGKSETPVAEVQREDGMGLGGEGGSLLGQVRTGPQAVA